MRDDNVTMVAPGVTRDNHRWGLIYCGRGEALLAAGIVKPEWLADGSERDRRGRVVRSKYGERNGRKLEIKRISTLRYEIREHYTDAEKDQVAKREELEKAQAAGARLLASLPTSHQQFRDYMAEYTEKLLPRFVPAGPMHLAGYRYSPEALEEIHEAAGELLRCLKHGATIFAAKDRAADVSTIRARAAKVDEGLQSFLRGLEVAPVQTSGLTPAGGRAE